jgi:hypothetical protein
MKSKILTDGKAGMRLVFACIAAGWMFWSAADVCHAQTPQPNLSPDLQEIVKLSQKQMGDDVITNYIRTSGKCYKLNADDIIYLNSQGVSHGVMSALLQTASSGGNPVSPDVNPGPSAIIVTPSIPSAPVPAASALNSGLAAYYPFNGDANDASGNGNNGMPQGASLTADRFGTMNNAFLFNGNGYVTISSSPSLKVTGTQITLAAWINPSQFTGSGNGRTILRKESQTGNSGGYYLRISNAGFVNFGGRYGNDLGFDTYAQNGALPLNTWSHVAATYDGNTVRFYVNGTVVDTTALNQSITADDDALNIGVLSPA